MISFPTYKKGLAYAKKIAISSRYDVALIHDYFKGYYIVPSGLVLKEEKDRVVEIIKYKKEDSPWI